MAQQFLEKPGHESASGTRRRCGPLQRRGAMKPRTDRAYRHAQHRGDRFVVAARSASRSTNTVRRRSGSSPSNARDRVGHFLGFEHPATHRRRGRASECRAAGPPPTCAAVRRNGSGAGSGAPPPGPASLPAPGASAPPSRGSQELPARRRPPGPRRGVPPRQAPEPRQPGVDDRGKLIFPATAGPVLVIEVAVAHPGACLYASLESLT